MAAFQNYIEFRTDTLYDSHVKFKGPGGRQLWFDPGFQPWLHVRIHGEVTSVPQRLTHIPFMQESAGKPVYVDSSPYRYKYLDDIVPEVQPGDRIYFHFHTLMNMKVGMVSEHGVHPDRHWIFRVRYDQVICAVREGKIIPVGSYALIEPDYETWEEILVPVASGMVDKFGKPIMKPKEQWIQKKLQPGYKYLKGFVRHVGTPLSGDLREIEGGQRIWYRKLADWLVKVEGTQYFAIRQKHIIGREQIN